MVFYSFKKFKKKDKIVEKREIKKLLDEGEMKSNTITKHIFLIHF